MARSERIQLSDLMPRHLKQTTDAPATVTIAVGSSMRDAQRQVVLRTFANANGDVARAAKLLGMAADDVRREMQALLNASGGTAGTGGGTEDNGRVVRRTPAASAAATETPAGKAKPVKKK